MSMYLYTSGLFLIWLVTMMYCSVRDERRDLPERTIEKWCFWKKMGVLAGAVVCSALWWLFVMYHIAKMLGDVRSKTEIEERNAK